MIITFFAQGEPKGQPRRAFAHGGKARVYDPGTAEGWKSCVAVAARGHLPEAPITGALSLQLSFHMPRPKSHHRKNGDLKLAAPDFHVGKPDADNLVKAVMDALSVLGMWVDDNQVCDLNITKRYALASRPGCRITIARLGVTP